VHASFLLSSTCPGFTNPLRVPLCLDEGAACALYKDRSPVFFFPFSFRDCLCGTSGPNSSSPGFFAFLFLSLTRETVRQACYYPFCKPAYFPAHTLLPRTFLVCSERTPAHDCVSGFTSGKGVSYHPPQLIIQSYAVFFYFRIP